MKQNTEYDFCCEIKLKKKQNKSETLLKTFYARDGFYRCCYKTKSINELNLEPKTKMIMHIN